jgi:hypothetical protein
MQLAARRDPMLSPASSSKSASATSGKRWGISYYVIFEPYVDAFAPVVARLTRG